MSYMYVHGEVRAIHLFFGLYAQFCDTLSLLQYVASFQLIVKFISQSGLEVHPQQISHQCSQQLGELLDLSPQLVVDISCIIGLHVWIIYPSDNNLDYIRWIVLYGIYRYYGDSVTESHVPLPFKGCCQMVGYESYLIYM